jgi:hypothetical protein
MGCFAAHTALDFCCVKQPGVRCELGIPRGAAGYKVQRERGKQAAFLPSRLL